jgi:hypothetical protein
VHYVVTVNPTDIHTGRQILYVDVESNVLTDRQLNRDSYISENKDVTVKKGTSIGKEDSGQA